MRGQGVRKSCVILCTYIYISAQDKNLTMLAEMGRTNTCVGSQKVTNEWVGSEKVLFNLM